MVRRKTTGELAQAEIKYESLVMKRDQYNAEAAVIRQERDELHARRGTILDQMRALRMDRSKLLDELAPHKARRNDLQAKARDLIETKRKLRGRLRSDLGGEISTLRRRVSEMEMRQQTNALTLRQENALLDEIKAGMVELRELAELHSQHQAVVSQVGDLDGRIDGLLKDAELEHQAVVGLAEKAQSIQGEVVEKMKEAAILTLEANKRHEALLQLREKANEFHEKAFEMKAKVITIRRQKREEVVEARRWIEDHRKIVRAVLDDEEKAEKAAEEALQLLLKKGKVDLRP